MAEKPKNAEVNEKVVLDPTRVAIIRQGLSIVAERTYQIDRLDGSITADQETYRQAQDTAARLAASLASQKSEKKRLESTINSVSSPIRGQIKELIPVVAEDLPGQLFILDAWMRLENGVQPESSLSSWLDTSTSKEHDAAMKRYSAIEAGQRSIVTDSSYSPNSGKSMRMFTIAGQARIEMSRFGELNVVIPTDSDQRSYLHGKEPDTDLFINTESLAKDFLVGEDEIIDYFTNEYKAPTISELFESLKSSSTHLSAESFLVQKNTLSALYELNLFESRAELVKDLEQYISSVAETAFGLNDVNGYPQVGGHKAVDDLSTILKSLEDLPGDQSDRLYNSVIDRIAQALQREKTNNDEVIIKAVAKAWGRDGEFSSLAAVSSALKERAAL